jgi:hypothetical protein
LNPPALRASESRFAPIAAAQTVPPPLPEGNVYVRGLLQRQRQTEDRLDQYTYDVLAIREELDDRGGVKKRSTEAFESFHVKGRRVQRKVAENGRPLSAAEQAKEDRRVQEQAAAVRAGTVVTEQPRVRLSLVMERYNFETAGREDVGGRPTLVFDFAPLPGKRDLQGDHVMRQLAGRLWVDEADQQVVRAELRNLGTIKVAAGLGARITGLETRVAFHKVDDAVWLPAAEETVASGRILLVKGFRTRFRREYSRFRRFEVTTEESPTGR